MEVRTAVESAFEQLFAECVKKEPTSKKQAVELDELDALLAPKPLMVAAVEKKAEISKAEPVDVKPSPSQHMRECPTCKKEFRGDFGLQKHLQSGCKEGFNESEMAEYMRECGTCGKSFKGEFGLNKHIRAGCTGSTPAQTPAVPREPETVRTAPTQDPSLRRCDGCGKDFKGDFGLQKHLRSGCSAKSGVSPRKSQVLRELESKIKTPPEASNVLTCSGCGKDFKGDFGLQKHIRSGCTGRSPLLRRLETKVVGGAVSALPSKICHTCKKEFRGDFGLQKHLQSGCKEGFNESEMAEYMRECGTCGKSFKGEFGLNKHIRAGCTGSTTTVRVAATRHETEAKAPSPKQPIATALDQSLKMKTCNSCGKSFKGDFGLQKHLNSGCTKSPSSKPFAFVEIDHKHREMSSGPQLKACPTCKKEFRGDFGLQKHLQSGCKEGFNESEMAEYMRECGTCGKSFKGEFGLNKHIRAGCTGSTPALRELEVKRPSPENMRACPSCGKEFRGDFGLNKHLAAGCKEGRFDGKENSRVGTPGKKERACRKCGRNFHIQGVDRHERVCSGKASRPTKLREAAAPHQIKAVHKKTIDKVTGRKHRRGRPPMSVKEVHEESLDIDKTIVVEEQDLGVEDSMRVVEGIDHFLLPPGQKPKVPFDESRACNVLVYYPKNMRGQRSGTFISDGAPAQFTGATFAGLRTRRSRVDDELLKLRENHLRRMSRAGIRPVSGGYSCPVPFLRRNVWRCRRRVVGSERPSKLRKLSRDKSKPVYEQNSPSLELGLGLELSHDKAAAIFAVDATGFEKMAESKKPQAVVGASKSTWFTNKVVAPKHGPASADGNAPKGGAEGDLKARDEEVVEADVQIPCGNDSFENPEMSLDDLFGDAPNTSSVAFAETRQRPECALSL